MSYTTVQYYRINNFNTDQLNDWEFFLLMLLSYTWNPPGIFFHLLSGLKFLCSAPEIKRNCDTYNGYV